MFRQTNVRSRTRDSGDTRRSPGGLTGGGHAASEGFNAGETIIGHVSNSSLDHPLIHLPTIAGVDLSVTKHVFMLWLVAAIVFIIVTTVVRRFLSSGRPVPTGFMSALEAVVLYVRDEWCSRTWAESGSTPGRRCC